MKRIILFVCVLASVLGLSQCKDNKKPETVEPETTTDTIKTETDSTIYGVALESGMSTLCIKTNAGDTLLLDKDDENGYGEIFGYTQEEDSFAVTKRKGTDGWVVVKAYNLSLLRHFTQNFAIHNGLLVLNGDTVDVKYIEDDSLVVVKTKNKEKLTLYPIKK